MIINSLLDSDFYKFTQGQLALHQFPSTNVEYEFRCRNDMKWTKEHHARLYQEVKHFCSLRFTEEELKYLSDLPFFKPSYIEFLRLYQSNINHLSMWMEDDQLCLTIKGPWFLTIYWEVPLLAMISEIYLESQHSDFANSANGWMNLKAKCNFVNEHPFKFVDFGTRRRASREWHDNLVWYLKHNAFPHFVGTSNVFLAKKYDLKPIGTHAHELMQVGQAIDVPLIDSQKRMLQAWSDEYRGNLGIALTDIIGIDAFLKDFDLYFAKLYDGVRHDSGSPYSWADKMIVHYRKLGIDTKTKTLVFSDGLNFEKCYELHKVYNDIINVSMGIGTNLTNDFDGITPLQIVIKVVECNGKPVAKISDSPGKGMCRDNEYVTYLKKVFGV